MNRPLAAVGLLSLALLAGCNTRHEIIFEQPKPLEVNVNLSGRLELVVTDARKDLEQITGEKPSQVVSPADIGLPAPSAGPTGSAGQPTSRGPTASVLGEPARAVVYLVSYGPVVGAAEPSALEASPADAAKARMAQRNPQIRGLWDAGTVGEAHTGLVVAKGDLSAAQQQLVAAENADRQVLYAEEAQRKNTAESNVALGYYVARLGYAQKGNWYEKFDKAANAWAWKKWGE